MASASPIDSKLWQSVLDGQANAFEAVVERYQGLVSAIAFTRLGNFQASQDVAQETFWIAWRNRNELREPSRLPAWLCGIARNLASQSARSLARQAAPLAEHLESIPDQQADPQDHAITSEEADLVWRAVEQLPANYREAVVLFYRQQQSVNEVADALELSADAVKQRLSRARAMLRDELAGIVESTLARSAPGKGFTSRVMAGLAAMGAASAASSASAATATTATSAAALGASGAASAASLGSATLASGKTLGAAAATGAGIGVMGGLLGAASGLAGAYVGSRLPAELAPTRTERELLKRQGRKTMIASFVFTLALLVLIAFMVWFRAIGVGIALLIALQLGFIGYCVIEARRTQKALMHIRQTIDPADDPNDSLWHQRFHALGVGGDGPAISYTSSWRILGLPLIDVQLRGHSNCSSGVARGWVALGDRAYGVLLGLGGLATGMVACGGMAFGGLAMGGLTLGVISIGGLALGAASIGGLAIGGWAMGGGAVGVHAAGGMALGWQSAFGGLAVARHVAGGGYAMAAEMAYGGSGSAAEFNTPAAKMAVEQGSLKPAMDWFIANQAWILIAVFVLAFSPAILQAIVLRRIRKSRGNIDASPGMPDDTSIS